ncbi:MAG: ABC transporter ATP-binding protein [Bacteroidota bacterium]
MNTPILHIEALSKSFSLLGEEHFFQLLFSIRKKTSTQIAPLENINLSVYKGEIIGVLGLNGSGKTTLTRIITGIYEQDAGTIKIDGKVVAIFALRSGFNPLLTGRENIYLKAALFGLNRKEIDQAMEEIIRFSELQEFIDKPLGIYSSGMKAKLGFAILTQVKADLFIIDEALAVGDKLFRQKCMNYLIDHKQQSSVIFITHVHEHLQQFADRILILNNGTFEFESTDYKTAIDYYDTLKNKLPE